jgi:hypothetical protein
LVGAFQFGGYGWYSGEGYFIPNVGGDLSLNDKVLLDDLDNEYNGSTPEPTPRIALAGDVNGDGLLDAVLSSPRYRRAAISIVLRKADNSGWEAPVRQVVYPAAAGYVNVEALPGALVDIDGDGDAEYVTDCIWKGLLHQQPTCGTRLQDTGGLADVNGLVPTLGATGPFRVGELTTIHVTGAPGGTAGVLVIRQPPQPYPLGGAPLLSPAFQRVVGLRPFTTSGQPGAAGVGAWNMPLNVSPAMAGTTLTYVALLADPAMSGQRVRTNVLGIEYGP